MVPVFIPILEIPSSTHIITNVNSRNAVNSYCSIAWIPLPLVSKHVKRISVWPTIFEKSPDEKCINHLILMNVIILYLPEVFRNINILCLIIIYFPVTNINISKKVTPSPHPNYSIYYVTS